MSARTKELWINFSEEGAQQAVGCVTGDSGGLRNIRSTSCYANAVIQLLAAVPTLSAIIEDHECERGLECIVCAFSKVLMRLHDDAAASPFAIFAAFHHHHPRWTFGEQQDALHFLELVLPSIAFDLVSGVVIETIQLSLSDTLTCQGCSTSRVHANPPSMSWDMGISAPSVQGCINGSLAEEVLEGEEAVNCDNCGTLQPTRRASAISAIGEVVFIYLNRLLGEGVRVETAVGIENMITIPTSSGPVRCSLSIAMLKADIHSFSSGTVSSNRQSGEQEMPSKRLTMALLSAKMDSTSTRTTLQAFRSPLAIPDTQLLVRRWFSWRTRGRMSRSQQSPIYSLQHLRFLP